MRRPPPKSPPFPYTPLFRSAVLDELRREFGTRLDALGRLNDSLDLLAEFLVRHTEDSRVDELGVHHQNVLGFLRIDVHPDRKSTRLNSSHANISYAVFCLKK